MDIDHHNPKLDKSRRNSYSNLYLATRHCNGSKSDTWPNPDEKSKGLRFLDPCSENDYGEHIFEDPETFRVWGATPAGSYHIRFLDLNADHLVDERRVRHELRALWKERGIVSFIGRVGEEPAALLGLRTLREQIELMIPPVAQRKPPKPGESNV